MLTPEQRAAQEERRRFIDAVVANAAAEADIENTPTGRAAYVERVVADLAAAQRDRAAAETGESAA